MMTLEVRNLDKLIAGFDKAPQLVGDELVKAVRDVGALILNTEKREIPAKTGTLRRSVNLRLFNIGVEVGPNSKYASWVHNGTGIFGPYGTPIVPKKAKVLAFKVGGKMIFARSVKGQPANPFVQRTIDSTEGKVNDIFNQVLTNTIEKL